MQFTLNDKGTDYIPINANTPHPLTTEQIQALEDYDLIYRTLCAILYNFVPTSGHPGGSISSGRYVAGLLFRALRYTFSDPDNEAADRITYAAGHKAMGLYAMWACRNEVMRTCNPTRLPNLANQLRLEDLLGFRRNPTTNTPLFLKHKAKPLDGHPTPLVPFVPIATGASGVGITVSVGLALALKDLYPENTPWVHAVEGEGGLTPGRVHEAVAAAATSGLDNLALHIDWNQASIDTNRVCRIANERGDYVQWDPRDLFMVHGFNVIDVEDGKSFPQIAAALQALDNIRTGQPTAVVYRTIKGWRYGIEGNKSHGAGHAFCSPGYYQALSEFESHFHLSFPRFDGEKTAEKVERNFFDTLMVLRTAFENQKARFKILADWIVDRHTLLEKAGRRMRTDAPKLDAMYENPAILSPKTPPESCRYKPGTSYTLRQALADTLNHLNHVTGGAFLAAAADLYGSTSISGIGKGFGEGFWHPITNPKSRLISAGGITEDAISGISAGASTVGHHIGVGSSYGAFMAPLASIAARLHGIAMQARHERNPKLLPNPFIMICAHAGVKTGEDGPTHAEPNSLTLLQENFPRGGMITLTPWEPNELWPLTVAALAKRPAVIAPFVTRPNETVPDRTALTLAPADAAATGVYRLLAANGRAEGTLVYQGSDVTIAFVEEVLPRLREKGINLDVYYVASAELFDMLDDETRRSIYPDEAASRAMMITGFTRPTTYRWVLSARGRKHTLHAFQKGHYLGSGQAKQVMKEAGLDGESQLQAILNYVTERSR